MAKPNILFITTDHQRADTLFMEQAGVEVTPNLNKLCDESCVFTRAYTTSPLCVPARTALATGIYPTKSGVVLNDLKKSSSGDHVPIHQYLAEQGYRMGHSGMQHIIANPPLADRAGFETFITKRDYDAFLAEHHVAPSVPNRRYTPVTELRNGIYAAYRYTSPYPCLWEPALHFFMDHYFADQAVRFIESSHGRTEPFALFVNIWAPHPPLAVPEPHASMFEPGQLNMPMNVNIPAIGEPGNRRTGVAAQLGEGLTMEEWRETWAAYLGLTHLADDCIGRLLEALKRTGKYENTVILFMSDHGDHLGQHRMYQKMEMYEQAVRVPLIIKAPGAEKRKVDSLVSHLDITPTILDMLDLDIPGDMDGISLKPQIMAGTPIRDRAVYCQYSGNPELGDTRRAVITEKYKYIYDPDDEAELYDLEADPLETVNRAAEPALSEVRKRLHGQLKRWSLEHHDWIDWK